MRRSVGPEGGAAVLDQIHEVSAHVDSEGSAVAPRGLSQVAASALRVAEPDPRGRIPRVRPNEFAIGALCSGLLSTQ
ncbi:MAG: hypothetical protein CMJ88_00715 [Planctomycetes bacterium]|nr:hypothetical protein [Planctomycetota bacterium]